MSTDIKYLLICKDTLLSDIPMSLSVTEHVCPKAPPGVSNTPQKEWVSLEPKYLIVVF